MRYDPTFHPVFGTTHYTWIEAARQVKGNLHLRNIIMAYCDFSSTYQDLVFNAENRRAFMRLYHMAHRDVIWRRNLETDMRHIVTLERRPRNRGVKPLISGSPGAVCIEPVRVRYYVVSGRKARQELKSALSYDESINDCDY